MSINVSMKTLRRALDQVNSELLHSAGLKNDATDAYIELEFISEDPGSGQLVECIKITGTG